MSTTESSTLRNGVDTAQLFGTLDAVKSNNELAQFQFRVTNEWISGTHNRSTIDSFYGVQQEMNHVAPHIIDGDHPAVLVGHDQGATPTEILLAALASCLTSGIANIAAARGVTLTKVHSVVTGDIDLRGILGLSGDVRNGFRQIRVAFELEGDDPDKLRAVVERSKARSAVFDMLTNGVPVDVTVS